MKRGTQTAKIEVRRTGMLMAGVAALGLGGCAEIELGAEAVKQVNRALAPAPQASAAVQVQSARAQATQSAASEVMAPGPNAQIDARMAPAPSDFDARGTAEWDGARTLQGIWVAHPQAHSARRVRILNITNGFAVDGALFRRDESGGGPPVIVSSDAAAALGMEPGQPVELSIVAIRRKTEAELAAAEAEADEVAAVAEPEAEEAPEPEVEGVAEPEEVEISEEAAALEVEAPEPEPEPEREIAEPVEAPEPEAPEPEAAEPEPESEPEVPEVIAVTEPEAEPAEEEAAETTFKFEPAPAAVTEPEEPAEQVAAVDTTASSTTSGGEISDGKPFIQAGIFGVPENVDRLIKKIKDAGLPALGRPLTVEGKTLTRVLSGPYDSTSARDAALAKIRKMGPSDATPVAR